MRDLLLLAIHLLATCTKLLRPGEVRAVAAESLLLKHQTLISNRSRQRAPNLTTLDRVVLGLTTVFIRLHRKRPDEIQIDLAATDVRTIAVTGNVENLLIARDKETATTQYAGERHENLRSKGGFSGAQRVIRRRVEKGLEPGRDNHFRAAVCDAKETRIKVTNARDLVGPEWRAGRIVNAQGLVFRPQPKRAPIAPVEERAAGPFALYVGQVAPKRYPQFRVARVQRAVVTRESSAHSLYSRKS